MRRLVFFLIIILATASLSIAQNYSQEDTELIKLAIEYSDNGNANKAIAIYDQLLTKYPSDGGLLYEKAYCYYIKQDFKTAIKILEKAEGTANAGGEVYALHGNCLDNIGKRKKAIEKYKEGISKSPDCGQLYLELGTVYVSENKVEEAVESYTEGIRVDPEYTSNYYRISQLLCKTNEPIWGIIYGEIHELLSPNSRRSEELSKAIYDAYNNNMRFEDDTTFHVSLTSKRMILTDGGKLDIPFEVLFEAYSSRDEDLFIVKEKGHLDMLSLVENRRALITAMFENGQNQEYLYPIFKYQKKVLEAGHWEAYNMWLLRKGNDDEFEAWLNDNERKFQAFVNWYSDNNFDPTAFE
ncbi:MAG: tetratricopeptide repeat protein [Bacteroidales bacterium]|nr:tetratricopeptide repeat protein [Bacteroidales bacterium]